MNTKICSRRGCKEAAKHKNGTSIYCDKHHIWKTRVSESWRRGKYIPKAQEFDDLWENLIKNNFKCPVCKQKMVVKTKIGEPRGNVISLQHWNNGDIELICHSCNVKHGGSKLGDDWKDIPDGHKYCPICDKTKPTQEFHKNKNNLDGLDGKCKPCSKQYKEANKDKVKNYQKNYYKKNENKIKERRKSYRKNNKEKIKTKSKIYREKNKEKVSVRNREYYKKNREKINARKRERYKKNKRNN